MEYKRVPIILKRFDFGSKMKICQEHSKEVMSINGLINIYELRQKPLPWELETFALFAVLTTWEYSNRSLEDRQGRRQFVNIINAIKNYEHPKLKITSDNKGFLKRFLIVTGLTQFPIQDDIRFKLYRYSYIFNFENVKVNMKQQFVEKFGCEYDEFKKLGFIIQCMFSKELNRQIDPSIMDYVFKKYNHVIKHLLMDREDFVSLQKKVTKDIPQYMYGYNYFYQFPFIRYNQDIFLPLPHLIIHSVTSSLLSRLTKGNNQLRSLFGKEVLESYLLHLSNLCESIDEVKSEYGYNFKRNGRRTLDIMIRKGNQCLMMDSKSMSPKFGLRDLTEKDVEDTVDRMVENVMQVYRHITERFQSEYYPFGTKIDFSKENVFGAVVLHEDNYIQREIIMMRAAEELDISHESDEYKYLCSNVKLISLYEFEQMMFRKDDVLQLLTDNRDNPIKWFDLTFIPPAEEGDKILRDDVSPTIESMQRIVFDFAQELVEVGIISQR
ncbi:hypothetical protein [Peribacillus frigoritolerans]|uniref:hypothetical protein n=1 Tax=Peribacillus frigoritolerans TaxID=450367 RepID=UPI0020BE5DA0|nr:hypothetical protein [Peribacillus frigoritolerans]